VAVLTGAGISRESGLPTFRDAQDGLWAKYDPMSLATAEAYLRDPALVWEWYEYRFGLARTAQPNPGHLAIAELATLVPRVQVITQNIDGLHQRAGSTGVLELHGSIHRYRCLQGHRGFVWSDFVDQTDRPPHCPRCGALLRPEVVWFGELLPELELAEAIAAAERADVMLIVGTSGVVQPAASLAVYAREAGAVLIDVNPEPDQLTALADHYLAGTAGATLPRLIAEVRAARGGHITGRIA
jgi:NAD-dependent deacetylase